MVVLKFMRFVLIIFAFLAAFFPIYINVSVFAEEISPIEKGIFDLEYMRLKLSAIENDMRFFLNRKHFDKPEWKERAQQAINDLNNLGDKLTKLDLQKELNPLKDEFKALIESLKKAYENIHEKSDEKVKEDFGVFQKAVEAYFENFGDVSKKYLKIPELPEGFDVFNEEVKYLKNDADRESFNRALDSAKEGRYTKANIILRCLLDGYIDSYFEASILLRISNYYRNMIDVVHTEYSTEILDDFLKKKQYSPILSRFFEAWRTRYQFSYHGASNWSEIPNQEYIEKRWHVIRIIEEYLEKNPEDKWAKYQIIELIGLPIIQRGGRFGNSNINHAVGLRRYLNE